MRCGNCGFVNNDSKKNCEKCGSILVTPKPEKAFTHYEEHIALGAPTVKGKSPNQSFMETSGGAAVINKCPYCDFYPLKFPVSQEHPCINCKRSGDTLQKPPMAIHNGGTIGITNPEFLGSTETGAITLTNTQTGKSLTFKGDSHVLNREMLNPNDLGLSSQGHVQFIKDKNGQWHISDLSSNHATFIQVQENMSIPPDTIVFLGRNFYKVTFE